MPELHRPAAAIAGGTVLAALVGLLLGLDAGTLAAVLIAENVAFGILLVLRLAGAFMRKRLHTAVLLGVFFGFAWYALALVVGGVWAVERLAPGWTVNAMILPVLAVAAGHIAGFFMDVRSRVPMPMPALGGAFVRLLVTGGAAVLVGPWGLVAVLVLYAVKAVGEYFAATRWGAALTA